jgi:isoquinoline 1-oxidoreductase beta subunit
VNIEFAAGDQSKYGSQVTGGSSTVRVHINACFVWGFSENDVNRSWCKKMECSAVECYALNGEVIHKPSGKKWGYGELVEAASALQHQRMLY